MKFYLSSYEIGDSQYQEQFTQMLQGTNKHIGYISNALDFSVPENPKGLEERISNDIQNLENCGAIVEGINLRDYFNQPEKLADKLFMLPGVFLIGGNTFILRQAFVLSGFDNWIHKNITTNFIYGGYSAACCILSPSLKGLQIVDNPNDNPYTEMQETMCEGLNILSYAFLLHYKSDHPESADIDKEISYAIDNKIPFKAFKDGEVEIFEINSL